MAKKKGVTLLEVLIAFIIVSIAFFGLLKTQLIGLTNTVNSEQRITAVHASYNIIDDMKANYKQAKNGSYNVNYSGSSSSSSSGLSSSGSVVSQNLSQWKHQINELDSGKGSISVNNNKITVHIKWVAPSDTVHNSTNSVHKHITVIGYL